MKNTRVARRYAMSLMQVVEETKQIDETAQDMEIAMKLIRSSREFRLLLSSPVVTPHKKIQILNDLFGSRVGKTTLAFMTLLTSKHREALLPVVVEEFLALRDSKEGIANVDVASAVEVTADQQKRLARQLEAYTKKLVRVRLTLDKSLKGGLVVKIGDTVLDASVKHQLELLRERLVEGGVLRTEVER